MTPILFGINNCDTVKRAIKWLNQHNIQFQFYDFKKQPLTSALLTQWLEQTSWTELINKRSTTYRQLPEQLKAQFSNQQMFAETLNQPTLLKRPLLAYQHQLFIGFDTTVYETLFSPMK